MPAHTYCRVYSGQSVIFTEKCNVLCWVETYGNTVMCLKLANRPLDMKNCLGRIISKLSWLRIGTCHSVSILQAYVCPSGSDRRSLNIDFRCLDPTRTCIRNVLSVFVLSTQPRSACTCLDVQPMPSPKDYAEARCRLHVWPTSCIVLHVYSGYVVVMYGSYAWSNALPSVQVGPAIIHVGNS